jgi:hypothetical protein
MSTTGKPRLPDHVREVLPSFAHALPICGFRNQPFAQVDKGLTSPKAGVTPCGVRRSEAINGTVGDEACNGRRLSQKQTEHGSPSVKAIAALP